MASLYQIRQFVTDVPGQSPLDALSDPPEGAVASLEWSREQARAVGNTDESLGPDVEFAHRDRLFNENDTRSQGHKQLA